MSWYKAGTVTLNNGQQTVTGVGTAFIANVNPGAIFVGPDGKMYEISNVSSDTALSLATGYAGPNAAGAAYSIAPTQSYIVTLAAQAATLLNTFGPFRDAYLAGILQSGVQGVLTDPSQLPAHPSPGTCYMIGNLIYVWNSSTSQWQSTSLQGPQGPTGDVNPANLTAAANALASQNAAATSATTATTQAGIATTQAGIATTQATTATNQANTATTQAGIATTQATAAAGSAAALTAALASFRSKFLGQFATDPTVDGNGNPLTAGAEYFNTTSQKLRVYSGTAWGDYDQTAQTATQNATLSAAQAAGSATTAGNGATTATTQAGIATTQATTATNASNTATTQAGIATTQAGIATGAATTATNEAGIATTQAQNAATSAAAAAQSAQQAAAGQVNSDWNATTGAAKILNKPVLAPVSYSGSYGDLLNKPTYAAVAVSGNYGDLVGKPVLAAVATSGNYSDLNGAPSGNVAWTTITGAINAVAGGAYACDTSLGPIPITLPPNPVADQTVSWRDYSGTFASNNVTIICNGNPINGVVGNLISDINGETRQATYRDATKGWLIS